MTDGLPPLSGLPASEPAPVAASIPRGEAEPELVSRRLKIDWAPLLLSLLAAGLLAAMAAGVVAASTVLACLAVGWTLVLGLRW